MASLVMSFIQLVSIDYERIAFKKFKGPERGGEEFLDLYGKKYQKLPRPQYMKGRIVNAIHEAYSQSKPLLIYIHNHNDTAVNQKFLNNTLANPEAIKVIVSL